MCGYELNINKIADERSLIEEFMSEHDNNLIPVFLWGGGAGVQWYISFCNTLDVTIEGIIDSNRKGTINSIPILSFEECLQQYENAIILISAPKYRKDIERTIHDNSKYVCYSLDPTCYVLHGRSIEEKRKYYTDNMDRIQNIFEKLSDQISKETFENYICGNITNSCDLYAENCTDNQYMVDCIMSHISEQEVFVDVGAFQGDSIKEFDNAVAHIFKKIYAFEPDKVNYDILINEVKDGRITTLNKGCGKRKESVSFYHNTDSLEGSKVCCDSKLASDTIEVTTLDEEIEEKITFIKMDVEGMELDALTGAQNLIKNYKPKLAISIYHKMEDIIDIPEYILSLRPDYTLYVRHFWDCNGTDTILFAI